MDAATPVLNLGLRAGEDEMLIALDYDGTYTADPGLWDHFIDVARSRNHEVHIVTMRADSEPIRIGRHVDRVHYTDRKAKRQFMDAKGLSVQIWIDDMPDFILGSAAPRDLQENANSGLWLPGEA
jgi:hypothetical protein